MSRAALVAVVVVWNVSFAFADEDPPKPRDATKPQRNEFGYTVFPVKGVPEPVKAPQLPLRLPEKIVGETRFHTPTGGATASIESPDGKYIVSAASNTFGAPLFFFDAKTGKELFRFYGHTSVANQLQFSPDGKRLFSGGKPVGVSSGRDGTLRVWDVPAKTEIFTAHARCWSLTPDAALLVVVEDRYVPNDGPDTLLRTKPVAVVYDAKALKKLKEHDLDFRPASVAVSPDGKRFAFGNHDGIVRVLDDSWKEVKKYVEFKKEDSVSNVVFSPDGKLLAAAAVPRYLGSDAAQPVVVWDAEKGEIVHRLGGMAALIDNPNAPVDGHHGGVISLQFTPNGKHLLSFDWGYTFICWDMEKGFVASSYKKLWGSSAIHFDARGERVFVGNQGFRPRAFSVPELKDKLLVETPAKPELSFAIATKLRDGKAEYEVTLSDAAVLKSGGFDGGVKLVNGSGKENRIFDKGRAVMFDITADEKTLVTFGHNLDGQGFDRPMKFWDVATGKETAAWRIIPRPDYNFRFSPDGKRLAILHADGYVRIWDVKTQTAILALDPDWHWPTALTWSKDGKKLIAGTRDAPVLLVWDVNEKK